MASSSAGPKAAKLAKLQNFKAKLPAHTQAALSAMIAEAQEHGLPELHTKKHQLQAREQLLASFHDPVLGPLVQSIDMELAEGGTTTMYFANFLVYLLGLCQQGGSYSQLFHSTHQLTPSTFDKPWRLIVYCDEITPGNVWAGSPGSVGASMPPSLNMASTCPKKMPGSPWPQKEPVL